MQVCQQEGSGSSAGARRCRAKRVAEILSDTPKTKSGGAEKVVGAKNETK